MSSEADHPAKRARTVDVSQRLYSVAEDAIDKARERLQEVSEEIWKNPELCFEEHFAHSTLTQFLEESGFSVTPSYTLDTAFRATYSRGSGGPNVAVLCEYDALPEIGHACGHNLIAEAGVATGLGLKAVLQSSGELSGTVTVLGTPAEEGAGGKVRMIKSGCFDNVDVAMMVHPDRRTQVKPQVSSMNEVLVTFNGRAAHAAAAPWEGVNALDAVVSAYTSLSLLRQQIKPTWRLHAIIKEGGVKPNIIPERAVLEAYVRAPTNTELAVLKRKVSAIFDSAAVATGCTVAVEWQSEDVASYSNLITNNILCQHFKEHLSDLGEEESPIAAELGLSGSTDMGNVSHVVPSIHPKILIATKEATHTRKFQAAANTQAAHTAIIRGAKAMARCGVDVLTQPNMLAAIKKDFQDSDEI